MLKSSMLPDEPIALTVDRFAAVATASGSAGHLFTLPLTKTI